MPSSILFSMWNWSSSSSSRSTSLRHRMDLSRKGAVNHQCSIRILGLRYLDDMRDGGRQPLPVGGLRFELFPAEAGEGIKLGPAVIFGLLPLGGDPAFLL